MVSPPGLVDSVSYAVQCAGAEVYRVPAGSPERAVRRPRPVETAPAGELELSVGRTEGLTRALLLTCLVELLQEDGRELRVRGDSAEHLRVFENLPGVSTVQVDSVGETRPSSVHGGLHPAQLVQELHCGRSRTFPAPRLSLSRAEVDWGWRMRDLLPHSRPVLLLTTVDHTGLLWDAPIADTLERTCDALAGGATCLHVCLSGRKHSEPLRMSLDPAPWVPDAPLENALVFRNLTVRQMIALMRFCDAYVGADRFLAGVAKAFHVPTFLFVDKAELHVARTSPHHWGRSRLCWYPGQRLCCPST